MPVMEKGTQEITLGDEKFDVEYEKTVFKSIEDLLGEASKGEKEAKFILKKLNSALDNDAKIAAKAKYIKEDDSAAVAASIAIQVKQYMDGMERLKKPVTKPEAIAQVRAFMGLS